MRTNRFKQRPLAIALAATLAFGGVTAYAADVEVRTPSGGGFAVRDTSGTLLRLFVDGITGEVTVPFLTSAPQQPNVVCFQTSTGMLGQCAPGSITGPQGPQGVQGAQGTLGVLGPQGAQGGAGPQGAQGGAGVQGPQGTVGAQGPQGTIGALGPQGTIGAQGPQGTIGAQGPAGSQGTAGAQGA